MQPRTGGGGYRFFCFLAHIRALSANSCRSPSPPGTCSAEFCLPNSAVLPSQNGGSPRTRSAEFPALLPLKEFVTRPCLANSPVLPSRKGFEGEAVLRRDPKAQKLALSRAQGPACNLFTCFATLATPRLCVRSFWLSKDLLTPSGAANRRVGPGGAELRARKPGPGYRLAPSASGAIAAYVRCPG